jgi:hypothetical protein
VRPWARDPRKRRLVRLASELRTTFTAIENGLRGKQGTWLAIGAAIGLAFGLALVTAVVRHKQHGPPPALPRATFARAPAPPASSWPVAPPARREPREEQDADARSLQDASVRPTGATRAPRAPDGKTESATTKIPAKRLPPLRSVDGTPLFTEPGF